MLRRNRDGKWGSFLGIHFPTPLAPPTYERWGAFRDAAGAGKQCDIRHRSALHATSSATVCGIFSPLSWSGSDVEGPRTLATTPHHALHYETAIGSLESKQATSREISSSPRHLVGRLSWMKWAAKGRYRSRFQCQLRRSPRDCATVCVCVSRQRAETPSGTCAERRWFPIVARRDRGPSWPLAGRDAVISRLAAPAAASSPDMPATLDALGSELPAWTLRKCGPYLVSPGFSLLKSNTCASDLMFSPSLSFSRLYLTFFRLHKLRLISIWLLVARPLKLSLPFTISE